jgi:hypothetical protein
MIFEINISKEHVKAYRLTSQDYEKSQQASCRKLGNYYHTEEQS